MIKNERQYQITKNQAEAFAIALGNVPRQSGNDPFVRALEEAALRSQLEELQQLLQEYEQLPSGDQAMREASFTDTM